MKNILSLLLCVGLLSACSELELGSHLAKQVPFPSDEERTVGDFKVGNPYRIKGRTYAPQETYRHSETGIASWYGPGFHGKLTANGEVFNQYELTAAHKTLQLPSIVRVTNLDNGRSIIVRVNDRGPFAHNRIIDLSEKAAEILGMKRTGTARVRVDVMEKESRQVAQAARNGVSTRGTEVVLNRGHHLDEKMPLVIATPESKPMVSQTRMASLQQKNQGTNMFKGMLISQANAAEIPRKPTFAPLNDYYVSAGQFRSIDDAMTLKMSLSHLAEPVAIKNYNNQAYNVNVGPFRSQDEAMRFMRSLQTNNRTATLVVVQK